MSFLQRIMGKWVRACVFQKGEYKRFSVFKKIIQMYDKRPKLDEIAYDYFSYILENIGGVKNKITALDGLAVIEYMIFRHEVFLKIIEENGGRWGKVNLTCLDEKKDLYKQNSKGDVFYLIYKTPTNCFYKNKRWKRFFYGSLGDLGWDRIQFIDDGGKRQYAYITNIGDLPLKKGHVFLRCHSPGKGYVSENVYIGRHLGMMCDICVFDYRGTLNSKGIPSEGGYYLDAITIFEQLVYKYKYELKKIWVTGFSLGAAVAAIIKLKYHRFGINYICENSFCSLKELIKKRNKIIKLVGFIGVNSILSKDKKTLKLIKQDFFNTAEKFNILINEKQTVCDKKGMVIIISTKNDSVVPNKSCKVLFNLSKCFSNAFMLFCENEYGEGHMVKPIENKDFWLKYIEILRNYNN